MSRNEQHPYGDRQGLSLDIPLSSHLPFSERLSLQLPMVGVTSIFGESGQGKTRLLRLIAGLDRVNGASIRFGDELWQHDGLFIPAHRRPVACVFQQNSLLSHLTAEQNLKFALKRRNPTASLKDFSNICDLLDIHHVMKRKPHQMSGGEQQRVAIAVALMCQPKLLLMDEPLASLDERRKQQILPYLEELHRASDIPIVYVSHSVDEVKRLADHIVWLSQHKLAFQGALSDAMQDLALAQHLGHEAGVVIDAEVTEISEQWHLAYLSFGEFGLWVKDVGLSLGQRSRLRVKAQDVSLALDNKDVSSIVNRLPATVIGINDLSDPAMLLVALALGDEIVLAKLTKRSVHNLGLELGLGVWMQVKSVAIL